MYVIRSISFKSSGIVYFFISSNFNYKINNFTFGSSKTIISSINEDIYFFFAFISRKNIIFIIIFNQIISYIF